MIKTSQEECDEDRSDDVHHASLSVWMGHNRTHYPALLLSEFSTSGVLLLYSLWQNVFNWRPLVLKFNFSSISFGMFENSGASEAFGLWPKNSCPHLQIHLPHYCKFLYLVSSRLFFIQSPISAECCSKTFNKIKKQTAYYWDFCFPALAPC